MSKHLNWGGSIRKIWPQESQKFRDHLLRLDPTARRLRFGSGVSDSFIEDYAARSSFGNCIIYGAMIDGRIRAAGELRKLADCWGPTAEAAFSVERPYEDLGLGTCLMKHVIGAARNRGVTHLCLSCLRENRKMQAVARKHGALLQFEMGDVVGEIVPKEPSYVSQFTEAVDDQFDFMLAMLDLTPAGGDAQGRPSP